MGPDSVLAQESLGPAWINFNIIQPGGSGFREMILVTAVFSQ